MSKDSDQAAAFELVNIHAEAVATPPEIVPIRVLSADLQLVKVILPVESVTELGEATGGPPDLLHPLARTDPGVSDHATQIYLVAAGKLPLSVAVVHVNPTDRPV